jgi:hypothetical protein
MKIRTLGTTWRIFDFETRPERRLSAQYGFRGTILRAERLFPACLMALR